MESLISEVQMNLASLTTATVIPTFSRVMFLWKPFNVVRRLAEKAVRSPKFTIVPYFIAPLFVVALLAGTAGDAQARQDNSTQSEKQNDGVAEFTTAIFKLATKARATPVTEPGIPIAQVRGQWNETLLKLTDDTYILTEKLEPQFKFYVQAILCTHGVGHVRSQSTKEWATFEAETDTGPKERGKLWDATLLGFRETASTFYEANITFNGFDLSFDDCMPVGMLVLQQPRGSRAMTSFDRVLEHMCNWLRFLMSAGDTLRSADFLNVILHKEKEVLLADDSDQNWRRLAAEIDLFDQMFPFSVFDTNLSLAGAGRAQARDFLQTTILLRRKLLLFSPGASDLIARDQALLQRLH